MIKDLAIYGAGGFGREVALLIDQINHRKKQYNFIGFFDDGLTVPKGLPFLGNRESVMDIRHSLELVIAIADPGTRKTIVTQIQNPKINFPVIVHPRANVGDIKNSLGQGTIITEGSILTTGISIGQFVIVNLATTIGHDAKIGDFCSIMPGTNISGNVKIGSQTLIGTGAKILQNISIGQQVKVGAGAVVIDDVSDNQTVIGVPAKTLNR